MADFPTRPDDVDADWIEAQLDKSGALNGARIESLDWQAIGTGQVGDTARFTLRYSSDAAQAPRTLAAKFPSADATSRQTATAFSLYRKEVLFYQQAAEHIAMRVPRTYAAMIDDNLCDFVLLFEDLGPCIAGNQLVGCTLAQAQDAMRQAAALHAPTFEHSLLDAAWLKPDPQANAALRALYPQAQAIFCERYANDLSPKLMAVCEGLNDNLDLWFDRTHRRRSLLHGDFRLDNMLFDIRDGAESIALVDWQTCAVGCNLTDIGYFLGCGIGSALRRPNEGALLDLYCAEMSRRGVMLTRDDIWDDYRIAALHGVSTAVFSAAFVVRTDRGDANFLSMAKGACELALEHDSLGALEAPDGARLMLTKGDDFPLHQTPEPVAYAGTDRNFYDRYFFNGYAPDGSGFFAVALGIYPHLNVADAHFSCIRNGKQFNLHVSRELGMERLDLSVGPISIEVVEPLKVLRVRVSGEGLSADLTFTGRAFPIEEPRFTYRIGPRTFMDYTRLTQNGHYTGWIEVDGDREDLASDTVGTRDRSWGVRPVGASDAQPHGHGVVSSFFWQWTPVNLPTRSLFFHVNADRHGAPWNTRAVIAPDGADHDGFYETPAASMQSPMQAGTRWPASGELSIQRPEGPLTLLFEPIVRFQMRGLGYTSPKWGHGLYHGVLAVEREDLVLADLDPMAPTFENLHVQIISRVTTSDGEIGIGGFEQLVIGPYAPWGLKGYDDPG